MVLYLVGIQVGWGMLGIRTEASVFLINDSIEQLLEDLKKTNISQLLLNIRFKGL